MIRTLKHGLLVSALLGALMVLLSSPLRVQAQRVADFPRVILSYNGSTTIPSLDAGGWMRLRTTGATPAVSAAGEARLYFNGTNWMISENGGAFRALTVIPNASITFAMWALNSCTANQIPKINAGGTAWTCGTDNTSPGGTAWVTAGNSGVSGGILGTTDAQGFGVRSNNIEIQRYESTGISTFLRDFYSLALGGIVATSGTTTVDSTVHYFRAQRWTGAANEVRDYGMYADQVTSASGDNVLRTIYNGSSISALDSGGNYSVTGSVTGANFIGGNAYYLSNARSTPGNSASGTGRIYFDSTNNRFLVSENAGSYQNLTGQGPTTWCTPDITDAQFPASANAYFATIQDHTTLEFINGSATGAYFLCTLPTTYDQSSLGVIINWAGQSTGNVVWGVNIENQNASGFTQNAAFAGGGGGGSTQTTLTAAASGTAHNMVQSQITYTNANAGTPGANNVIRIRLQRVGNSGSDTMAAMANLHAIYVRK